VPGTADRAEGASESAAAGTAYDPLEIVAVPEPSDEARTFHASGHWVWAGSQIVSILIPLAILLTPLGSRLDGWAGRHGIGRVGAVALFVAALMIVSFLIRLPWSFTAGHLRMKAYGLSNQTAAAWFGDSLKMLFVMILVQCLTAAIVWGVLVVRFPRTWWLWTAAGTLPFLLAGVFLTPLVIDPLFNTFGPMKNKTLEAEILSLAQRAGVAGSHVFEVDKSRQTKAINAYVTGIFGSKRIVLWDTLLNALPPRQVNAVVAHELGHYVLGHVRWGILIGSVSAFGGMFLLDRTARWAIANWGQRLHVGSLSDSTAIVLVVLLVSLGELVFAPFTNAVSRTMERQADTFAIELTRDPAAVAHAFSTLQKENLGVPFPNWFYRTWRSTHPSIGERIEYANGYRPWMRGQHGRFERHFSK
jgi:Zn-dependent protease with chaperone function